MTRQGHGRSQNFDSADPQVLERKLRSIRNGKIKNALDEFLARRVPIQFGGMSDPFSSQELNEGATLDLLRILKKYEAPYIISTKGDILKSPKYLKLFCESDCYIRFSTSVTTLSERKYVDHRTPSAEKLFEAARVLAELNIPTSFRLQPMFPDSTETAMEYIAMAENAGVKHISVEFLKIPIDADLKFSTQVKSVLGGNPVRSYIDRGAEKRGREYVLPISYRGEQHQILRDFVHSLGMTYGYADNDLLLHSDGSSCCGAADLYLKTASFFHSNLVGQANITPLGEVFGIDQVLSEWYPQGQVSQFFNSSARLDNYKNLETDWPSYIKRAWEGKGVYEPEFFSGIQKTGTFDNNGFELLKRVPTEFDNFMCNGREMG